MTPLDDLFILTGPCGHSAPVLQWTETPISGELPENEFQCPICARAFARRPTDSPWKPIVLAPISPRL